MLFDLWERKSLDFSLMILVVSEALEDLGAAQIRKRGANAVNIPTKKKVGNDIVHTDSCAFDPRVSTADSFGLHDVAIVRCGFHEANYITTFRKITWIARIGSWLASAAADALQLDARLGAPSPATAGTPYRFFYLYYPCNPW